MEIAESAYGSDKAGLVCGYLFRPGARGDIFGMNVRGIPFSEAGFGFWIVVLVMTAVVGLAGVLAWVRSRSRRF
ncbi:MAG TPA: hypothetical protein VFU28_07355 [Vicinamibacterales bacterium]|nr:hypothetical protein [Vicinamibacterales bacterium]